MMKMMKMMKKKNDNLHRCSSTVCIDLEYCERASPSIIPSKNQYRQPCSLFPGNKNTPCKEYFPNDMGKVFDILKK
jgi:hypothetical protein